MSFHSQVQLLRYSICFFVDLETKDLAIDSSVAIATPFFRMTVAVCAYLYRRKDIGSKIYFNRCLQRSLDDYLIVTV